MQSIGAALEAGCGTTDSHGEDAAVVLLVHDYDAERLLLAAVRPRDQGGACALLLRPLFIRLEMRSPLRPHLLRLLSSGHQLQPGIDHAPHAVRLCIGLNRARAR